MTKKMTDKQLSKALRDFYADNLADPSDLMFADDPIEDNLLSIAAKRIDELSKQNKKTNKNPTPKIGENWYIQLHGSLALSKMSVENITELTVSLKNLTYNPFISIPYLKSSITFIERIENE